MFVACMRSPFDWRYGSDGRIQDNRTNSTEKREKEARGGMARRAKSKRSMYATFMSGTSNRSTFHIPTLTATSLIHAYLFCVLALLSMPPLPICVLLSSTVVEPLQRGFGSCSSNFYLTTIPRFSVLFCNYSQACIDYCSLYHITSIVLIYWCSFTFEDLSYRLTR